MAMQFRMKVIQVAFLYFAPQSATLNVVVDESIVVLRLYHLYCRSRMSSIDSVVFGSLFL